MTDKLEQLPPSMLYAIGNTPLVQLNKVVPDNCADILVKLEFYNPTGSYKDRMALAMIEEAEKRDELRPGMTVVEYTGGSTGSSLAFVCAAKGYRFRVVSSDAYAQEKLATMRAFGAELELLPSQGGKITPDLIPRLIERAKAIAREEGAYPTDQFNNRDSLKGYAQIGYELVSQLNRPIDAFCGGVGTAGMLMGVARALREEGHKTKIVALEPATSPVITTGTGGAHHVEGIGVGFVPPLLDKDYYDEARAIDEGEARQMARRLAREEGLFAGTSTGLNVVGALQLGQELGPGHTVVTVICDTGLKYLAGELYA
ncbi:MAG: PLP-dependent cysteine synthase family protein [Anaerolineae bacterium]|nr:PLP-dependent cysteine synthase family protein [Anaerolineae bacterium]